MTAYIRREIHISVAKALKVMPVVVITGMRQTGKTTFLQNDPLLKNFRYLTLDDFATLQTARTQPEALIKSGDRLIIDEVQKAPELLTAIKRIVDRQRDAGQFILSGSANFSLLKGLSESLAGRAIYLTLEPFSQREIDRHIDDSPFLVDLITGKNKIEMSKVSAIDADKILLGGMPSVRNLNYENASVWFQGFEQTYIERDIRDFARVDDILGFRTAIKLAALRTGQLLNFSQLARDAKLSLATITRYIQLAETSFLFRRLPPYLRNRSSRLIKSPKLYVADSGLACHLSDVEGLKIEDDEPMRGVMFETYMLQNISSILGTHLPDARITYWHVQGRYEVDFIIEYKKICIALELKSAARWSERDLASLKIFLDNTPSCKAGILVYNGRQTAQLGEKLWAVPMGMMVL